MEAKHSEVLKGMDAELSCVVSGLTKKLDSVSWKKPNSEESVADGTEGYQLDEGSYDNETLSQTTVLTIPANKTAADSVYTCVFTSIEHQVFDMEVDVGQDVFCEFLS